MSLGRSLFGAVVFAVVIAVAGWAWGEVPPEINYQGRLLDSAGTPLGGEHSLVFRIFGALEGGAALWTESQSVEADSAGVFAAILGGASPLNIGFDGPMWLEVEVDGEVLAPRRGMVSVPFAFHASASDSLGGMHSSSFALTGHTHDDRYYTETELSSVGTVNQEGNPVEWTRLKGVPDGLADGTDDVGGAGDGHSLDASDGDPVDAVYVDAQGKVGIGTASPSTRLHVREDANAQIGITLENRDTGAASAERISFNDENGGVAGIITFDDGNPGFPNGMRILNNRTGGGIAFQIGAGADLVRLLNGKMGIRTADPLAYLHLRGDEVPGVSVPLGTEMAIEDDQPVLYFLSPNTATQSILFGDPEDNDAGSIRYGHADNCLRFRTGGAERIVVAGDGRVGVGAAAQPGVELYVVQNSSTSGATAIYGMSSSATVAGTFGVRGTVATGDATTEAAGVYGAATSPTGIGVGVEGRGAGASGAGVWGWAYHTSGRNVGVAGQTDSPNGYAGYFTGGRNYFEGKVGIGIDQPANPLHVYGTGSTSGGVAGYPEVMGHFRATGGHTAVSVDAEAATLDAIIYLGKEGNAYWDLRNDSDVGNSLQWRFQGGTGQNKPYVTVENSGQVGIGTTTPGARLSVVDSVGTTGAIVAVNKKAADGVGAQFVGNNQIQWTDLNGCGLAATGNKWGLLAVSSKTTLEAGAVHGVFVDGGTVTAQTRLCYRSAAGTLYKVHGDGASATVMATSSGKRTLVCPESPEAWFEDYGSGEIKSGACHVELDPLFLDCITVSEEHPLKVFVQLTSPLEQQYFVKKGQSGFDVVVTGGGADAATATFDYKVVGKWKGYEKVRFEQAPESADVIEVTSADSE